MASTPSRKLALTLVLLVSCSEDTGLGERLEKLAASNVGRSVDIGIATPFAWDEVAVFGPYYPKRNACNTLRLSAWGCFWLNYPKPDDSSPSLIAFLHKRELAATAKLPRCKIQVTLSSRLGEARGNPRFVSSRNDEGCQQGVYRLTQE